MTVEQLIDKLLELNPDEKVVIGNRKCFWEATKDKSCELEDVVEVTEGVLYAEQEEVVALLF